MKIFKNAVAAFVILIIFLIIIPLPTVVLDFMFILNLAVSFVILSLMTHVHQRTASVLHLSLTSVDYNDAPPGAEYIVHPVDSQRRLCR